MTGLSQAMTLIGVLTNGICRRGEFVEKGSVSGWVLQIVQKLMVESVALRLALPVARIGQLSLRLFDELPGRTNSFAMPIQMTDSVGALSPKAKIRLKSL